MIRRLSRCIREYKWPTVLSPLCMVGEVAMEVLIPLVMTRLYRQGVAAGRSDIVVQWSIVLVLCALVSLAFGASSAFLASKAATGFARNLRHDMFHHVQRFSFRNIDKFSAASIVTRLTSDVATLQMSFQMMIRMAIRSPMMLILAASKAYTISPKLCLVYCVVLPLLGFALIFSVRVLVAFSISLALSVFPSRVNALPFLVKVLPLTVCSPSASSVNAIMRVLLPAGDEVILSVADCIAGCSFVSDFFD